LRAVFYTLDEEVIRLAGTLGEAVEVVSSAEEVQEIVDLASTTGLCVVFIDYDQDPEEAETLNSSLVGIAHVRRVVITTELALKDLKKHQKGKEGAHAYIRKPLYRKITKGVMNDFEVANYLVKNDLLEEGTEIGPLPKASLSIKAASLQEDDSEDGISLDEPTRATEVSESHHLTEIRVDTAVRKTIDKHSIGDKAPDFESEVNEKVQSRFDQVFAGANKHSDADDQDDFDDLSLPDVTSGSSKSAPVIAVDLDLGAGGGDFDLDLGDSSESEQEVESNDVSEEIEDLNLSETEASIEKVEESMSEDNENDDLSFEIEDEGLDFDTDGDSASETPLAADSSDEESLDFELGDDDSAEIDLAAGTDVEVDLGAESSEDELDLGSDDSSDELDLGGAEAESEELDLGSDDAEIDELDLGGEEELDLGGDDVTVDELDIGDEDSEEELSFGEQEAAPSTGTRSQDSVDVALSEIIAEDDSSEEMNFDSEELDADIVENNDSTNPTMVFTGSMDAKVSADGAELFETASEDEGTGEGDFQEMGLSPDEFQDDDATATATAKGLSVLEGGAGNELDDLVDEELISESLDDEIEEEPISAGQMNIRQGGAPVVVSSLSENELLRLQATIRQLREERDGLLKEIRDLKTDNKSLEQDNLGLKADLDDAKIELSIIKKRHGDEIDEMKYRLRIGDEKRLVAEEKTKKLQKEFERLDQKVRMDIGQIKQREKELESKLELTTMDSESQVRSRDMKILELKRKIDQLEFNMENAVIREQKSRDDKNKLEDRIQKIMKTLRGSIEVLEDDVIPVHGHQKNHGQKE
jgi:hypothetical protein